MSTLATMPRWFRATLVLTAVAGATVGGMAGSAYALPRVCGEMRIPTIAAGDSD
jgi:hypothetical protein